MNNLKAERTLTAEERVSDDRLAEMILSAKYDAVNQTSARYQREAQEQASVLTELQRLRSQSLSTQQPMGEGRVKLLEWKYHVSDSLYATTEFGNYYAYSDGTWSDPSTHYYEQDGGIEDAKGRAQIDYERRVLSALNPNQESGE